MASELDLDDVAAQSQLAMRELEALRMELKSERDEVFRLQGSHSALYAEVDALRKDAERWRWLTRHASLGFDGAPSWNAVVRLPVFDADDQTIDALVDSAIRVTRWGTDD